MKVLTKARRALLACGLGLGAIGCGADNPAALPLTDPHPFDGTWIGRTGGGDRVELAIHQSRVVSFQADLMLGRSGATTCLAMLRGQPMAPVDGRQFAFSVGSAGLAEAPVSGSLESSRKLSGRIGPVTMHVQTTPSCEPGGEAFTFTAAH